jgi:hypothetical protein
MHTLLVQLLNEMAPGTSFQKLPILSTYLIITFYITIACPVANEIVLGFLRILKFSKTELAS